MNNNTSANILSKEVATYSHSTDLLQSKPQPKDRGTSQAKTTSRKPQSKATEKPKLNENDRPKSATEEDERRKRKFPLTKKVISVLC